MIWFVAVALAQQSPWQVARTFEARGEYARALAVCDGSEERRCRRIVQRLAPREDPQGGFAGLQELHAVRTQWRSADQDDLSRRVDTLLSVPRSPTFEAEVRLWIGLDALSRRRDFERVVEVTEGWAPLPDTVSDLYVAGQLISVRSQALAELGRLDEAKALEALVEVEQQGLRRRRTRVDEVAIAHQRRQISAMSWVVLALTGTTLLGGLAWKRPSVSGARPRGLGALVVVLFGLWATCYAWDPIAAAPIGLIALGWSTIHLLAGPLLRQTAGWVQMWVRLCAGCATVAVVWLALDRYHATGWVGW